MSDLKSGFFQECDDLLEALSDGLTALDDGCADSGTIHAMFRAVHSIKGGAGAFALDQLVEFAHAFENLLDDLRSGRSEIGAPVIALMFAASDHLNHLVDIYREDGAPDLAVGQSILADLRLITGDSGDDVQEETLAASFAPLTLDLDGLEVDAPPSDVDRDNRLQIRFEAGDAFFRTGNDPALILRALGDLGAVETRVDDSALPPLTELDCERSYLVWDLTLALGPGVDRAQIEEVFEFVEGIARIDLGPADFEQFELAPEAALTAADSLLAAAPVAPEETPIANAPPPRKPAAVSRQTIRVDLPKVDRLINLVGELVICEAMLRQSMSGLGVTTHSAIDNAMAQFKQLSGILQESVMTIRAQPVRGLFQRMSRIAREAGRETGKDLKVVTLGDSVELDTIVTERLVDPLTHMIRNAVDHGLESAEVRQEMGKPERGTITLSAEHRSGRVVITLTDDGGGIDRARVRAVAEAKGLIGPEDDLSEADVDNLLFLPGFSTNAEVSTLSGRGVGMDVVRSEVQALGGRVSLQSRPGIGTSAVISLPLTLAVLDGMLVGVAGQTVVVPTAALRETYRAASVSVHDLGEGDRVINVHGTLIPTVDLGATLGFRAGPAPLSTGTLLLVESNDGKGSALIVDEIFGQREVVIKGLEQNYRQVPGISAATILGDGSIALIIDVDQLITPAPPWSLTAPPPDPSTFSGVSPHV